MMTGFITQLKTWHDEFMAGKHSDVKSIPAWAYTAIDDYIRNEENKYFTPYEEIKETAAPAPSNLDGQETW